MKYPNSIMILLALVLFLSCSEDKEVVFAHPLQAFEENIGTWNWVDVDGMICRDSTSTGISVRLGSNSKKWVIYLQGGGACFTVSTCLDNPSNYNKDDFTMEEINGDYSVGLLNNQRSENPVKDWNIVFVPYCTGDVHSGNLENGVPLGGTEFQQFVGNRNIKILLKYLQPYMEHGEMDELMIAGISAGGFGTHITYFEAKALFPNIKTTLINDSGPLISDPQVLPFCLGIGMQFLYNLAIPNGFIFCCTPTYGLADIYTLAANYYPEDNFGLLSYMEDNTIRYFFSAGQNTCSGGDITGEAFKGGLIHLREQVLKPTDKWSTYYVTGDSHTFIQSDNRFYETVAQDKALYDWVKDVMNGQVQHIEE